MDETAPLDRRGNGVPRRLRFIREFWWTVPEKPSVTIRYLAGRAYFVRLACARAALAAGAAEAVETAAEGAG